MSENSEKVSSRSAIILAIVVVLVAAYAVEFGLQTLVWGETRHWAKYNPWLLETPQSLPASGAPAAAGSKDDYVKAYGYQFLPPWHGKMTPQSASTGTIFRFETGAVVFLFDPGTQVDTLRQMESANSSEYLAILSIFGPKPFDSNYSLYQSVYGASPGQTSPFQSRAASLRLDQLVLMKLSFGMEAPGDIFSIQTGKNRGLQFGDPAKGMPVAVHLFNERDEQFRMIFTVAAGSNGKITQDDINGVAGSFERIPILMHE